MGNSMAISPKFPHKPVELDWHSLADVYDVATGSDSWVQRRTGHVSDLKRRAELTSIFCLELDSLLAPFRLATVLRC